MLRWGLFLLFCAISGAAHATCSGVPNTFTPGTTAQSGQVNGNFTALTNCINAIDTGQITTGTLSNARLNNAGVTPISGVNCTLGSACNIGAFKTINIQKFTAAGTYTPTAGLVFAIVECIGNGGGGGGAAGSATGNSSGGGGGSGSYARVHLTAAQIGVSQSVTFGVTGAGGSAGNNSGTNGGDVALGVLCVGKGGAGGGGALNSSVGLGGAGGGNGTGDITVPGTGGATGIGSSIATINGYTPFGGAGPFGGNGSTPLLCNASAQNGQQGFSFGSGGNGACSNGTASTGSGGAGDTGVVIVTEFINT